MAIRKREALSRMIRNWLAANRSGKLATDQWLNLVTAPLMTIIILGVPLLFIFFLTPLRLFLRFGAYSRYILPLFLISVMLMLILRARRYARLPLYQDVVFAGADSSGLGTRLRRQMTLYTERGDPIEFSGFALDPPHLEKDMSYLIYYLEEDGRRTLLSFAPMEHPDIERWQPTDQFFKRQQKRNG